MPQKGIPVPTVQLPNGTVQMVNGDAAGNVKTSAAINAGLTKVAPVSAASILKASGGLAASANNLAVLTTTQVAALTTSSIGTLYDAPVAGLNLTTTQIAQLASSNIAALTTTQVALLTTTQVAALIPQADLGTFAVKAKIPLDTPTANSIVVVPGTGQVLAVVIE